MRVELTALGDLIVPADVAQRCFGEAPSVMVAVRDGELWLIAIGQRAVGGLLLKQRNARGDRSVLVIEQLRVADWTPGPRTAHWDESERALRVPLSTAEVETVA